MCRIWICIIYDTCVRFWNEEIGPKTIQKSAIIQQQVWPKPAPSPNQTLFANNPSFSSVSSFEHTFKCLNGVKRNARVFQQFWVSNSPLNVSIRSQTPKHFTALCFQKSCHIWLEFKIVLPCCQWLNLFRNSVLVWLVGLDVSQISNAPLPVTDRHTHTCVTHNPAFLVIGFGKYTMIRTF